jgi:thiamine biosynthesis lipoprotein
MGSRFELMAISVDSTQARQAIDAGYREIDRIEQLISSWIPGSETDQINKAAGIKPVKVSKELFDLISRSIKVSKLTDGAFDISFAGMEKIWEFNRQVVLELPDAQLVASAVKKVNYQNIALDHDESTVFLTNTGMRIGFGSIGKGYAANRAMKVMKDLGIVSGMVNAGGDLITWGQNKAGKAWSMGIADPNKENKILAWLNLQDMALVTSGDYQKYFIHDGKRYGHILDPRTGYPALGLKSVSILCPDAELADALATAVYVMGADKGMDLINQLHGVEGLVITDDDRVLESENLTLNYYAATD